MAKSSKLNLLKFKPIAAVSSKLQSYYPELQYLKSYDGVEIPITVIGNLDKHAGSTKLIGSKDAEHLAEDIAKKTKPVLLLHAFGMDSRQFLPFILPLLSEYRFYLPHFRGFGLAATTPTTEFNFIEQYAKDVDVMLTHICHKHEVESVDVAAISMGALVVWAYFNQVYQSAGIIKKRIVKNRIGRYLNIDQSPIVHNQHDWQGGVFGDKQAQIFDQFQTILAATLPYLDKFKTTEFNHLPFSIKRQITQMETAFSLLSVDRLPSRLLVNTSGYFPAHKLALYQHPNWQQKLRGLHAYLELPYDYREVLPHTNVPVTLLIGGKSQLYDPKWQRKLAEILPDADIIDVPKSGHAIPMDAPLRFTSILKQFLHNA